MRERQGRISRRAFLATAAAANSAVLDTMIAETPDLQGEIGLTTGSFMKHLAHASPTGRFRILDLPKIMRDELDMRVLDLMTRTLESFDPEYLEQLRAAAKDNHCIITNLKMNQPVDMASLDLETRKQALKTYKETIDVAKRLGCRWVRPVPGKGKSPDKKILAASFDELIDYAGSKGISLLIENTGWISSDSDAIPAMIKAVGDRLTASPDTGNWNDQVRFDGLEKAFPLASTCDFKAYQLEPGGSHPRYDLKRCFQTGWDAGFRGPWCIEHFNESLEGLLAGFATVRDRLRQWTAEQA